MGIICTDKTFLACRSFYLFFFYSIFAIRFYLNMNSPALLGIILSVIMVTAKQSTSMKANEDSILENNKRQQKPLLEGADTELDHPLTPAKRQRLIRSIIGWGLNLLRDTEEQGEDVPGCLKMMKYCKKTTRYGKVQKIGTCCGGYKCGIAGYCEPA